MNTPFLNAIHRHPWGATSNHGAISARKFSVVRGVYWYYYSLINTSNLRQVQWLVPNLSVKGKHYSVFQPEGW